MHAASRKLASLIFVFFVCCFLTVTVSNCLSGFSLSCSFCLFPPLLSFSFGISLTFPHNFFHLYATVSDLLVSTQLHCNLLPFTPQRHPKHTPTRSFSQEPPGPTSRAACGSPGRSRCGENMPGLRGHQGRPGGLRLPTLPTL